MTSPTLNNNVLMRTREKRAVREFRPKLWLDGRSGIGVANGEAVPAWTSRDATHHAFAQETAGSQPTYTAATKSVTFAGTDDYLTKATPTLTGTTTGRISITCSTSVTNAAQVLYSQADEAGSTAYCQVGISAANVMSYEFRNGAGAAVTLVGNLTLGTGMHLLEWATDGSKIYMWVDHSPQTIAGTNTTGSWFGDVTGADNSTIGCKVDSTGVVSPLTGTIAEIVALEPDDTALNADRLRRQLGRLGSVTIETGIAFLLANGTGFMLVDGTGLLKG